MVAYALSRKRNVATLHASQLVEEFSKMRIDATMEDTTCTLAALTVQLLLKDKIKDDQGKDKFLVMLRDRVQDGDLKGFTLSYDGTLTYEGRICIPKDEELRREILHEHTTPPIVFTQEGQKCTRILRNIFGGET